MVRGQYLSHKKLKQLDSEERVIYLAEVFDIPEPDLRKGLMKIWDIGGYLTDRVHGGAEYLWELTQDPVSITGTNVGAIIRKPEEWEMSREKGVDTLIHNLFYDEKEQIKELYPELEGRLNVTATQLLREEIVPELLTVEDVIEELKVWRNTGYGVTDWLRGTMIPTRIEEREATLLGVYWGDGYIRDYPRTLALCGRKDDFEFYEGFVSPMISEIHGIPAPVTEIEESRRRDGKTYIFSFPGICINSKAIVKWLVDDLGFPNTPKKTDIGLPHGIEWGDGKKYAFFMGIIGSMGVLRADRVMFLHDKDYTFIDNLERFSESLGFTPLKYVKKIDNPLNSGKTSIQHVLLYSPREVDTMAGMGLINPKHQIRYGESLLMLLGMSSN